jgi:hypothetical protein
MGPQSSFDRWHPDSTRGEPMNCRLAKVSWRTCVSSLSALVVAVGVSACGTHTTSTPESAHFALMRTPGKELPATVRRVLRTPTSGMSWSLARRIAVPLPGSYWMVPGDGYLCIVARADPASPGVGTTCTPTAQAIEHGVVYVSITPPNPAAHVAPSRLVVGVAPDGVREVLVHTRGLVAKVPVVDAVFMRRDAVAAPPDFVALRRGRAR